MAKRRKKKRIKVSLLPLGRQRVVGLAFQGLNEIEVDFRVKPKFFLQILAHECAHLHFSEICESRIDEFGRRVAEVIWAANFRRIYDENKLMSPRPKRKKKS